MNAQQIKDSVADFLASRGIAYMTSYAGETVRDNDWKCDRWSVTLKRDEGKRSIREDYFTGLGHRKQVKPMPAPAYRKGTLAYVAWEKEAFKPQAPDAAGVLHSLLLNSLAADMSFMDWCAEFDYDTDSRKALGLYERCCTIGAELRRFFSAEERAALSEMLQDY